MWGTRPAIIIAALRLIKSQRAVKPIDDRLDLFAGNVPLYRRLRIAHSYRNNVTWWSERFDELHNIPFSTQLIYIISLFVLASSMVIIKIAERVAAYLDSLSNEQWKFVISLIQPELARPVETAKPESVPIHFISIRLAYLIALKEPAKYGRTIFVDYFRDLNTGSRLIDEFRQERAVEAASANSIKWDEALTIVKNTYSRGATHHVRRLGPIGSINLPESVAKEVLEHAGQYPIYMWELAESCASTTARKAIRAVGLIAKKDKWFST
jgi:hypothetical protein